MTPTGCQRCGEVFLPKWLPLLKKWSRCCGRCGLLNLADFLEAPTPGETIHEIHLGEQNGAHLREIAGE